MPLRYPRRAALPLATGEVTVYQVGGDSSYRKGLVKAYSILTAGAHSGTTNVDNPEYAAATIAFVNATSKITDSANGLATFKTGDTIRVRGSTSNDGVYTVATGNVAGEIVTTEALVDEGAAAYITLCKRVTPSNNAVIDLNTGLMWRRDSTATTGAVEKVGPASDGLIYMYNATAAYTLHPAAADLQMIATGTLRIVGGAGELSRYFAGMILLCAGFANAANNLPGLIVTAVAVNGADLDISISAPGVTLVAEAAGGSRSIKVVCQCSYSYVAAMNAASFAGYTDWRVPNVYELVSITDFEAATGVPDATAFPNWPGVAMHTSTSRPSATTSAINVHFAGTLGGVATKLTAYTACFVRGG